MATTCRPNGGLVSNDLALSNLVATKITGRHINSEPHRVNGR